MALQLRRGAYEDFDPDKMVAAEVAVVTEGDPNSASGRSIYMCFEPGVVKRLADYEDILDLFEDAEDEALEEAIARLEESVETIVDHVEDIQEDVDEKATLSESYARGGTGTRTGEDTDNAKYYMEQAAEIVGFTPESTYPFLTAGQLLSTHETTDNTPYNFRTVEQESTLEYGEIVGGTVAFNQLAKAVSDFSCYNASKSVADGVLTATITNAAINNQIYQTHSIPANHVLLEVILLKPSVNTHGYLSIGVSGFATSKTAYSGNTWHTIEAIKKPTSASTELSLYYNADAEMGVGATCQMKEPQLIDLTQMLGTTIADYIYSLESATAGAGVAWLKKHFPKIFQYHAYDAGSLVIVSGLSEHVTTGKNRFQTTMASTSSGGVTFTANADGTISLSGTVSGSYVQVTIGTVSLAAGSYVISDGGLGSANIETYISGVSGASTKTGGSFVISEPITNRNVYFWINGGTIVTGKVVKPMICSNSATNPTIYEPYISHTYPLDSTKTFRGIYKLDSSNRLYADGDVYKPDGTVVRRYGIVDLGTLSWTYRNDGTDYTPYFWTYTQNFPQGNIKYNGPWTYVVQNAICNKYPTVAKNANVFIDKTFTLDGGSGVTSQLRLKDSSYTDAATFKAAMSGVYLVYELATPTTETAEPYTDPQIVAPGGTEEYISTSVVPVGHESMYPDDLRTKLDDLPRNLSMIAPIENGTTASQAYAVGKYFMHNNQFCKAKTAIASGATLTLNTNYEVTTVAAELYSALH